MLVREKPAMTRRWLIGVLAATAMVLHCNQQLNAQSRGTYQKNAPAVKQSVAELTSPLAQSVVEILLDARIVALGTIVTADGLIVTKASEIKDATMLRCRLWDDRVLQPEILATDTALDLALLRLPLGNLTPIDLSSTHRPTAGSFLITVGTGGEALGLGIASVDGRKFDLRQSTEGERGFLGVNCDLDEKRKCLVVQSVTENSAARRAGIRQGDMILTINDRPIALVEQFHREIRQRKAGDAIQLSIRRGEQQITIQAELGSRPMNDAYDQWGGGPFSKRRFSFDPVIVHDTPVAPEQCGSPLLDTDGRVVGINIARALRVASYALPADQVAAFIKKHVGAAESNQPAGG